MLILWIGAEQPIWAAPGQTVESRLCAALLTITRDSLVAQLRSILSPEYVTRAREIAARMTKPTENVTAAADLLEDTARRKDVD